MRVRVFELRLLAGALSIAWALAAGLILLAYRPGGPLDLVVGLAAGLPIVVAVAGLVWPPVARGNRAFAAVAWLGIGSLLLLAPSIAAVLAQLQARGPQTLLPSVEAAYPWALALLGTGVFSGLGVAARSLGQSALRRRRLVRGVVTGLAVTTVIGGIFAGVAVGNDIALQDRTVATSRFGPTDPAATLPQCDGAIRAGSSARVDMIVSGDVDGRPLGTIDVRGVRNHPDFRWLAYVASSRTLGQYGEARVGSHAWAREPGSGWREIHRSKVTDPTLDERILAVALDPETRIAAEALGVSIFEGARARHCRVAVDGDTFRAAAPHIGWLVGEADLRRWRGEIEYWVFSDGQLGRVAGGVSGEGAAIEQGGLQGSLRIALTATDRDRRHAVVPPAP